MTRKLWIVGGFVRDYLLNHKQASKYAAKDVDFALEGDSYEDMRDYLLREYPGFEIVREDPESARLIGGIPREYLHSTRAMFYEMFGKDTPSILYADFTLCRKQGGYTFFSDDVSLVIPGTIQEDLARRDFTVNAIAVEDSTETILDPFNGCEGLERPILITVGAPVDRFKEDPIRILRYYRLHLTRKLNRSSLVDFEIIDKASTYSNLLASIKLRDRCREEVNKMLKEDSLAAMLLFSTVLPSKIANTVFNTNGIWLKATTETK